MPCKSCATKSATIESKNATIQQLEATIERNEQANRRMRDQHNLEIRRLRANVPRDQHDLEIRRMNDLIASHKQYGTKMHGEWANLKAKFNQMRDYANDLEKQLEEEKEKNKKYQEEANNVKEKEKNKKYQEGTKNVEEDDNVVIVEDSENEEPLPKKTKFNQMRDYANIKKYAKYLEKQLEEEKEKNKKYQEAGGNEEVNKARSRGKHPGKKNRRALRNKLARMEGNQCLELNDEN
uniref:ERV/ALR sulfhydryl oxidase domain-containing protein n=1 Tax=Meloidogyne incognita TaxID=6306 RepID=A0A914KVK9_MELIC